jgi:hypothetical protein
MRQQGGRHLRRIDGGLAVFRVEGFSPVPQCPSAPVPQGPRAPVHRMAARHARCQGRPRLGPGASGGAGP